MPIFGQMTGEPWEDICIRPLTAADAEAYFRLYADPAISPGEPPFLDGESGSDFLSRIRSLCEVLLGIFDGPLLVGDCALHHWQAERASIEIGGALLPGYQGRGIMSRAFIALQGQASARRARTVIGRTAPENRAAIRLVLGLGYQSAGIRDGEAVFLLQLRS